MNTIADLVLAEAVLPKVAASAKRQALGVIVDALTAPLGLDPREVLEAVLLRERLAGTGVGEGVAIPHARVGGLRQPIGALARLDPAIDFDALDGRPADLVFLLLAPVDRGADHLKALARISRYLRRSEVREKLRGAQTQPELVALLTNGLSDAA